MIEWIKKIFRIVNKYDFDMAYLQSRIEKAERVIKERTDIHADVHYKSDNQIIVIGRYRNRDYIQTFNIHTEDFKGLVDELKRLENTGILRVSMHRHT